MTCFFFSKATIFDGGSLPKEFFRKDIPPGRELSTVSRKIIIVWAIDLARINMYLF
jgi:hypothetical protein